MHVDRRSFVRYLAGSAPVLSLIGPAGLALGDQETARRKPLRVRVWCEAAAPRTIYPDDIDGALADQLGRLPDLAVTRGRLSDPQAGLSDEALDATDVLIWWGHLRHDDV